MSTTKKSSLFGFQGNIPSALINAFTDAAYAYPAVKIKPRPVPKSYEPNRVLSVLLSDQHYGTDLKPSEHLLAFSNKEEARRTAHITKNVIEYKLDKRDQTRLQVLLNGDQFAGLLGHDDRATAELTVQMMRCAHIVTQQIGHFASAFSQVDVYIEYGNHGRNLLRHMGRANNTKWENFELLCMLMVKGQCRNLTNVQWHIPRRPVLFWKVFNHTFGMTHGDTILGSKPGTPGFAKTLHSMTSSEYYKLHGRLDVMLLGHWHTGMLFQEGSTTVVVNSALLPPDGNSESGGYLNGCGQWLLETTPDHAIGDSRLVRVGESQDKDSSLDSIITPWSENLVFTDVSDE